MFPLKKISQSGTGSSRERNPQSNVQRGGIRALLFGLNYWEMQMIIVSLFSLFFFDSYVGSVKEVSSISKSTSKSQAEYLIQHS